MAKGSGFGKGFVYNLILFAKHWGQLMVVEGTARDATLSYFMNNAGDHMFEFEVPKKLNGTPLCKRFKKLRERILNARISVESDTKEQESCIDGIYEELEDLVMELDKWLGVDAVKADYN